MNITRLTQFPSPESEPDYDWTIFSSFERGFQRNFMVYAAARDYLSTPRTHIVVEFDSGKKNSFNCRQYDCLDYFGRRGLEERELEYGIFQFVDHAERNRFLFLMCDILVEISSQDISIVETLYHCLDSQTAIDEFFHSI